MRKVEKRGGFLKYGLRKNERKFRLDRTENDFWDEEKRIRQGKKVKTISEKSEREFRSELKTEFRRYVKDTQRILKGVSRGEYRKQIKF